MIGWRREIYIGDLHAAYRAGSLTATELAVQMRTRLSGEGLPRTITDRFAGITDIDAYDEVMDVVWNYGDFMRILFNSAAPKDEVQP